MAHTLGLGISPQQAPACGCHHLHFTSYPVLTKEFNLQRKCQASGPSHGFLAKHGSGQGAHHWAGEAVTFVGTTAQTTFPRQE